VSTAQMAVRWLIEAFCQFGLPAPPTPLYSALRGHPSLSCATDAWHTTADHIAVATEIAVLLPQRYLSPVPLACTADTAQQRSPRSPTPLPRYLRMTHYLRPHRRCRWYGRFHLPTFSLFTPS